MSTLLFGNARLREEARLMFVLADSLFHRGALHGETEARWAELKRRIDATGEYEAEAGSLFELLKDCADAGVLTGTWIEARWNCLRARVHA